MKTTMDGKGLKRKNIWKFLRTILQAAFLIGMVLWVVFSIRGERKRKETEAAEAAAAAAAALSAVTGEEVEEVIEEQAYVSGYANGNMTPGQAQGGYLPEDKDKRFICISYNGLTTSDKLSSKLVTQKAFNEQIAALKASGYVSITQQDVINCWLYHMPLPEKSMLLVFEDGIFSTANLAQPALEKFNYKATMCTYANNLDDLEGKYMTTANIQELLANSYWELGSNGYRLSYINVFDHYKNYFGHLNLDEFLAVDEYLKRDYNHYLMDFLRDEDRLRQETTEEMEERIAYDYEQMQDIYQAELGFVPSLYVLMHSNTKAFGNDPQVSDKNREMLMKVFGMNFNRQGSCLNTTDSSVYDLTRLQSRHYFSTNHLMMRVWDDTGDEVVFVVGDVKEAKKWNISEGVAQYADDNKIILTSMPHGNGTMRLNDTTITDVDMTVTLQGNVVGRQSIFLRADDDLTRGVEVALEDGRLVIREPITGEKELFALDLFKFDGGPFYTEEQDELNGLIALQKAIIEFDEDEERVMEAEKKLATLENRTVVNLKEGGTPYIPQIDISKRDERYLRIRLTGSRISLWLDDKLVADHIPVVSTESGNVVLQAGVSNNNERFSQANLDDDVYDAVYIDPIIRSASDENKIIYSYTVWPEKAAEAAPEEEKSTGEKVLQFFIDTF